MLWENHCIKAMITIMTKVSRVHCHELLKLGTHVYCRLKMPGMTSELVVP